MKTMTCDQLGGACNKAFTAETFEEMAELSKQHGMEMFAQKDAAHLDAMNRMKEISQDPAAMQSWFEERRREFDALPDEP